MPQTKFQKLMFALITVIITVPCFVFYCSSYEAGGFNLEVIKNSWIFIPIEFILAYLCEVFIGSPLSVKLALKAIDPKKNDHMIVETAIICATVGIMCPLMSFLATIIYNGIIAVGMGGAPLDNFLINFIPYQPLTRTIFRLIFKNKTEKEEKQEEPELVEIKL